MKLKVKMVLLLVVAMMGFLFIAVCADMSELRQRQADQSLAETKTVLAQRLDVEPEDIMVYWSGEYLPKDQYRYRFVSGGSYASEVEPRYGDYVITDKDIKKLIDRTVNYRYSAERWETSSLLGLLVGTISCISAPYVIISHVAKQEQRQRRE